MTKPERRLLRFSQMQDIVTEIERLEQKGYHQAGNWNLSQICEHLADWMSFPMDGFPKAPWFVRVAFAIMRTLRGKELLAKFIADQRMPTGQPTARSTVHSTSEEKASESVCRLKRTIDRLTGYRGPIHPSPLFGELNHEQLVQLQLAHCAHHLSFLLPKT